MSLLRYNSCSSHRKERLRGAGCIRLRLSLVALTREPDTASTVGGKDAHMGRLCVALHLDGFAMRHFFQEVEIPMNNKTKRLTESAMLIALAVVLEFVGRAVIPPMPFGGQLTLVSMLPIVLISYRHGVKWGLIAGFGYSLVQMAMGADVVTAAFQPGYFGDGLMLFNAVLMCLLDYVLAYTLLGLGGLFRDKISNSGTALMAGSLVALGCRYLCHIFSGYILFGSYAEWFFTQEGFPAWGASLVASLNPGVLALVYSIVYNGMYMIPEMILTAIAAVLVARVPKIAVKVN